eukprot:TRINITY_DN5742_c0_g2_i1.p1 TRINITY_DN5742_c0_g2~~TRINITY_DN5742_c0_g2_i1.p1  ORF type:complete len:588 (+),score=65.98 TRINITY_DN5742_c0_g2_i1:10-1773(+)
MKTLPILAILILCTTIPLIKASVTSHLYKVEEKITVYGNKVGPYDNPSVSYRYVDKKNPFCQPIIVDYKNQHLGEIIEGDKKAESVYHLNFAKNTPRQIACDFPLSEKDRHTLSKFISNRFVFELVIDDIPVRAELGYSDKVHENQYVYSHIHFNMIYSSDDGKEGWVIFSNVTLSEPINFMDPKVDSIEYSYTATWSRVDVKFEDRIKYYKKMFFDSTQHTKEMEIHWISLINSLLLIFFLSFFVVMTFLRAIKSDLIKIEEDEDYNEGWKILSRDVFRFPKRLSLLTAILGSGTQFLVINILILFLAVVGTYYPTNDGAIYVSILILYSLTCVVSGYVSAYWYSSFGGKDWTWNLVFSSMIFTGPFFVISFILNIIAAASRVTKALPFTTIIVIILIWGILGFILNVIGGIAGRRSSAEFIPPIKAKNFPIRTPEQPIYLKLVPKTLFAGLLPFSVIFVEIHYILNSLWAYATYQLWGMLVIVFILLIIVNVCVSVVATYIQLSSEDPNWWWHSILNGGSATFYIWLYSLYYYIVHTNMSGFYQTAMYFGYTSIICLYFFIHLGTISFFASFYFVKRIYSGLHYE